MGFSIVYLLLLLQIKIVFLEVNIPIIVNTWPFVGAADEAWKVLDAGGSALDAIEHGASYCEREQCDGTVGFGSNPDEDGETTLDAMIMDGKTMNVGAIGGLRRVKNVISVARNVLDHSKHSLLVGDLATQYAVEMGFREESLVSPHSKDMWKQWHNDNNCQPNYWINVTPDPSKSCGPYKKAALLDPSAHKHVYQIDRYNHDTIGLVAVDERGNVAAGTSTNGLKFKIPGRVGDSPIPGAGAYADNDVGAAVATGDGDVMLRFLPSFLAVEEMRHGASPKEAADTAVNRISAHYPEFRGAVIVLSKDGRYAAACNGMEQFPFVVHNLNTTNSELLHVPCNIVF